MTDTPKKPGRPRKTAPKPADLPSKASKPEPGPQVAELPTISVEELIEGMDEALVLRLHVALARHMIKDHRMTWGEVRVSMGYGLQGQDPQQDELWRQVFRQAQA